ncbi:MAG: substrate-binding domain-containing protein, partial [Limibacillus sp.]
MEENGEALRVITSGAFAAALTKLLPAFEAQFDGSIDLQFGSSLGAAKDSIPTRLSEGERFDVFFLAASAIERYSEQGYIDKDSRIDLVESHIGATVRVADPAP